MTIEEKAKAYDEALNWMRELYPGLHGATKEDAEHYFPELRKINEEEIRKDIIGGLMWQRDNLKSEGPHDNNLILPGFCLSVGKHLAYLEKQNHEGKKWLTPEELHRIEQLRYDAGFDAGVRSEAEKQKDHFRVK